VYPGNPFVLKRWIALLPLFVLAALTQPALASGQQSSAARTPTLSAEQLVAWVQQRNPSLAQLKAAVEEAASRVLPAGSLDDPQLSYSFAPGTIDGFRRPDGSTGGFNQRIELSQAVPWPGTLALREEEAQRRTEAAEFQLADHHLRIIAAIKAGYAEWYFVYRALDINESNQALLIELRNIAQAQYAAGRAGQQDVLQAEVRHAALEEQRLVLQKQKRSIQAQINALLNRPPAEPLPPPGTLPDPERPMSYEQLQERALAAHPELKRLHAELQASQTRIELAEKRFYPNFQFMAGYNSLWDQSDKEWTIGASINIPLDRSKYDSALDAARASAMQARWQLVDRRSRLLADLERARAEVSEAVDQVELYRSRLVPLAEESLVAARADYRSGLRDFLNVITAQEKKLIAELGLERAHANYLRRLAELERWTGDGLDPAALPATETGDFSNE
jgi:outer membrane protein TolC